MKPKKQRYKWAVPKNINAPPDNLIARIDFYNESCVLTFVNASGINETRMVSAFDVAHALASELSFNSGILPPNILWWANTANGPVYAIWEEPRTRRVALQSKALKAPARYNIPLPGLIFLCSPGKPPAVYAVKSKPWKDMDIVYKAPLCNLFSDGHSCPGSHKYPVDVSKMVESFFVSLFSPTADLKNRSLKFPLSVVSLWKYLHNKKQYPLSDLVKHGTIKDLMGAK